MLRATILLALLSAACGGAPERPACSPAALASIEGRFNAEALVLCQGHTYDTCPDLPGLREKYKRERAEWEHCR
jgi:hypothetical protein